MISNILIAIAWWFVWWLMSFVLHYYNLKKESFFRLQEKWEVLLASLYGYQDDLCKIDLQKDSIYNEEIKTAEELEKFLKKESNFTDFLSQHQALREKIWAIIVLYFLNLENDFRIYTMIEINHKETNEFELSTMNLRENKLSEIGIKIYKLINESRKVFLWFKI